MLPGVWAYSLYLLWSFWSLAFEIKMGVLSTFCAPTTTVLTGFRCIILYYIIVMGWTRAACILPLALSNLLYIILYMESCYIHTCYATGCVRFKRPMFRERVTRSD